VHDDALHADAALARLVEGADDDARDRVVDVGVLVHDHRRVAAQLEHDLLLARLGLDPPPRRGRTGEAQELQAFVRRELPRPVPRTRQDRERPLRQVALRQHFADQERPDRRPARGLQDERTPRRDRRRHLVGGEIQRKVER